MENFINFLKQNWKNICLFIAALLIIVLAMSTTCQRQNNDVLKNNLKALTDTVHTLKAKNGELIYAKQSLVIERDNLNEYLKVSKAEIKDLEKQLDGKIKQLAKMQGQIRIDTLICHDSVFIANDTTKVYFDYENEWVRLNGKTLCILDSCDTEIGNLIMEIPLKIGWTENRKVFAETQNPYVTFSNIDAAIIETPTKKDSPKRWNVGLQIGIGGQYGIIHKTFDVGPYVGVGLSYGFGF